MLIHILDLGAIRYGVPHRFSYAIKNDTTKTIKVNRISLGCTSCTKAHMNNDTLGPSQEALVYVEFTPGVVGKNRKSITLVTDEGNHKMEFVADVQS